VPRHRTLWEEGRHPGRLVAQTAAALLVVAVLLNLLVADRLGLVFDVVFVLVCVGAALAVRPRDFFAVGVLPPLLLLGVVGGLALGDRAMVASADDGFVQAVVSGLAHHAGALVVGYGLTLAVLALRQVALRNHGVLRVPQQRPPSPATPVPAQRPPSRVP
jgi:hypothetical protein